MDGKLEKQGCEEGLRQNIGKDIWMKGPIPVKRGTTNPLKHRLHLYTS